jgi:2-keto-3-deoxy-L-rhamnonate aldolase RhmA
VISLSLRAEMLRDFRARLIEPSSFLVGHWVQLGDHYSTEKSIEFAPDWICFDLEHGMLSEHELAKFVGYSWRQNKLPIVRVESDSELRLRKALEFGAAGLIVPNIMNKSQWLQVQDAALLAPYGSRGLGYCPANDYGVDMKGFIDFYQSPLLIPIIESKEGLLNLADILSAGRIDCVFIGPYDLTASLGIPGEFANKIFEEAIQQIQSICRSHHVPCGIHSVTTDKNKLLDYRAGGFSFCAYSTDAEMIRCAFEMAHL